MEEITSFLSDENKYEINPILNLKSNYSLSYGEKTNLIRWVNSIDDPLCKQVNSIEELKQGSTILALLYQYLTKTNNLQLLKFLDSININISNEEKMNIALQVLYKIDTNDYIKNNYNFFQKNIEYILNDNNIIFDIIKSINNLYKNISKVNGKFYTMNTSPNKIFIDKEDKDKILRKYLKTKTARISQKQPSITEFYNYNVRKKTFAIDNNSLKEAYPTFKGEKNYKNNSYFNFNQNSNRSKKKYLVNKNNNTYVNFNGSNTQNNLNEKQHLMNNEEINKNKNNSDLNKKPVIYYPVKLYNTNSLKVFNENRSARDYLLKELEKLNEITDIKNKNSKPNDYNSYRKESIDETPLKINNTNFENNNRSRAFSQNSLLNKNLNNSKIDYRNRLFYKTAIENIENNNIPEPLLAKMSQEEKISDKINLNTANIFGIISLDKNIAIQGNISSNNINVYKILKLSCPIIDINYNKIQKYDNSRNQSFDSNHDNKDNKMNDNEITEHKIIVRNNSSLINSMNSIQNNNIRNDIIRNNSTNFSERIYLKTDTVPPLIKNIVYLWLSDIELINKDTINIESLPIACSDGIILCDIINRFECRNNLINGIFRKITTRSQSLANIKKALEHLKKIGKFPLKHLWHGEKISQGDEKVIWEILYDLYKYYSKITGYRANYKDQLINQYNSSNYVHKQNTKSASFREASAKNNGFIQNNNDFLKKNSISIMDNNNHENFLKGGIYSDTEENVNVYHKSMLKTDKDDDIKNFNFFRTQFDKYENGNRDDDSEYRKGRTYYGISEKLPDKINKKYYYNYNYNDFNTETENSNDIRMLNKDN